MRADLREGASHQATLAGGEGLREAMISVVVVAHNPGSYVREMLESLVSQSSPADEIIYYDDGSTDDSLAILEEFREKLPMLRVIKGDSQAGISRARNRANQMAGSEYVAVLDADDYLHPEAIKKYREAIVGSGFPDLVCGDTAVFRQGAMTSRRRRYPRLSATKGCVWKSMAMPVLPFKHSSMLYRKDCVAKLGGYDESLSSKVDFDLLMRFLTGGGKIAKLDFPVSFHRKHPGQISARRLRGILIYWGIIGKYETNPVIRFLLCGIRSAGELAKLLARG